MKHPSVKTEPNPPPDREGRASNGFRIQDFLNEMQRRSLSRSLTYTGLAKADDLNPDALFFSMSGVGRWIRLDQSSLERIDYLGARTHENQEYALVTVTIKPPTCPGGEAIARLADHARSSVQPAGIVQTQEEFGGGCPSCLRYCARIPIPAIRNACIMGCFEGPCAE